MARKGKFSGENVFLYIFLFFSFCVFSQTGVSSLICYNISILNEV